MKMDISGYYGSVKAVSYRRRDRIDALTLHDEDPKSNITLYFNSREDVENFARDVMRAVGIKCECRSLGEQGDGTFRVERSA